ncbi:MAG: BolA/IbaG family iron-sulfur metabolism protein [Gammaproteobacteria bacterium]
MNSELIVEAIRQSLGDARVSVSGEGCRFELEVVSSAFEGLPPVRRQQRVYACLAPFIESGDLHAVSMKTFTPDQVSETKNT